MRLFTLFLLTTLISIYSAKAKYQTDTLDVKYPNLFYGLDSLGVTTFDNTKLWCNDNGISKYGLLVGLENKYPVASEPILLKTNNNWFITYSGTGLVFQLTNDYTKAIRIDRTLHTGYNYAQFAFVAGPAMHSLGGYGFWHMNSILRRFYYGQSYEWHFFDAINNGDLFCLNNTQSLLQVYNIKGYEKIYVANVCVLGNTPNKFIKTNKVYTCGFDNSKYWTYIGNTIDVFKNSFYICQSTNEVVVYNKLGYCLLDFSTNSYVILDSNIIKNYVGHIPNYVDKITFYLDKHVFSCYNLETGEWSHHKLSDKDWRSGKGMVYIPYNSKSYLRIIITCIAIISVVIICVWVIIKKRKVTTNNYVSAVEAHQPADLIMSIADFVKTLDVSALELLSIIINNNNVITIDSLNRLLGVINKPASVQKIHRHKTITAINNNFCLLTRQGEELIVRKRDEQDKRSYSYHINDTYLDSIRKVINQ